LPNNGTDGIVVLMQTQTNKYVPVLYMLPIQRSHGYRCSNFEVKNKELRKQYRVFNQTLAVTSGQKIPFTSIKPKSNKAFYKFGFVIGTQNTTELICITN
jgi:hypothetical protein